LAAEVAGDVDQFPFIQPCLAAVFVVQKNTPPSVLHAAIAVVEPVDRGVVLIVRAHRLEQQPTRRHVDRGDLTEAQLDAALDVLAMTRPG